MRKPFNPFTVGMLTLLLLSFLLSSCSLSNQKDKEQAEAYLKQIQPLGVEMAQTGKEWDEFRKNSEGKTDQQIAEELQALIVKSRDLSDKVSAILPANSELLAVHNPLAKVASEQLLGMTEFMSYVETLDSSKITSGNQHLAASVDAAREFAVKLSELKQKYKLQ